MNRDDISNPQPLHVDSEMDIMERLVDHSGLRRHVVEIDELKFHKSTICAYFKTGNAEVFIYLDNGENIRLRVYPSSHPLRKELENKVLEAAEWEIVRDGRSYSLHL